MSTPPTPGVSSSGSSEGLLDRIRGFWQRISEGRQLDELWSQFTADARASYGFYMKEAEGLESQRGFRRLFGIAKTLFWSLLMKLTPARRVLLLVAFAMLVMSGIKFQVGKPAALDRLMMVIADVAGKSVPAALLMATLQASLRTIAGENAPLVDLVARLNRYACAHSLNGLRFTTAVLSEYNPLSRNLTYVNAGHNAPILRRANGTLETLEAGGLPLGIQSAAKYETASLELKPGDLLIFFTDGVVEAFNESGEEFGNARWLSAIRDLPDWDAQQTLQFLMKRVDEFVGATRQSDDITCLVFRSK